MEIIFKFQEDLFNLVNLHYVYCITHLQVSANWRWLQVADDQRLVANVTGDDEPDAVGFLALGPDVDRQGDQIVAGRYHQIGQQYWGPEVQDHESPGSGVHSLDDQGLLGWPTKESAPGECYVVPLEIERIANNRDGFDIFRKFSIFILGSKRHGD